MGKHRIGERTCKGCGRKSNKAELLRFVIDVDNEIVLDLRQNQPGRGGYLCPRASCFALIGKKRRIFRGRKEVRWDAPSLIRQVGCELVREMQALTGAPPEAASVALEGGTTPGASLPRMHSRKAERIGKTYTAFFSGGGAACPT